MKPAIDEANIQAFGDSPAKVIQDPRRGVPSASIMDRLQNCPGSFLATINLPDEESDEAASGTRIHKALELGDSAGLSPDEETTFDMCREQTNNLLEAWDNENV